MARKIKITEIADLMEEEIQTVVRLTALEWTQKVKEKTPVRVVLSSDPPSYRGGGDLRNAWQTQIGKFEAEIINNMEYAEPVLYGKNLPPSWNNEYRTRQGTVPGFPDLIGKEIATTRVPKFIAAFRRRN
jgi:hypothetical protein|tara:strand:+ start:99 stop:488 length:390 start_codon:yes stop_codon:yes gene_type:complete